MHELNVDKLMLAICLNVVVMILVMIMTFLSSYIQIKMKKITNYCFTSSNCISRHLSLTTNAVPWSPLEVFPYMLERISWQHDSTDCHWPLVLLKCWAAAFELQ